MLPVIVFLVLWSLPLVLFVVGVIRDHSGGGYDSSSSGGTDGGDDGDGGDGGGEA